MNKPNRFLALAAIAPMLTFGTTGCLELLDYLPDDVVDSHGKGES